jgi:hypothetical protein
MSSHSDVAGARLPEPGRRGHGCAVTIWDLKAGRQFRTIRTGDRLFRLPIVRREPGRKLDRTWRLERAHVLRGFVGGTGVGFVDRRGALADRTRPHRQRGRLQRGWRVSRRGRLRRGDEDRRPLRSGGPSGGRAGGRLELLRRRVQLGRPPGGHGRVQQPRGERVRVWDWAGRDVLLTIDAERPSAQVDFDPHGPRVVCCLVRMDSRRYGMWRAVRARPYWPDLPEVSRTSPFSPDGSRIAIASADGLVRLFDADTGAPQLSLRGSGCAVEGVAFSPDGTKLASTSWCDGVGVWALVIDDLLEIARRRPGDRSPTRSAASTSTRTSALGRDGRFLLIRSHRVPADLKPPPSTFSRG